MDPLSALGVAAAVVQFLDFSSGLISGTYKIYKAEDGDAPTNQTLRKVATDLKDISDQLNQKGDSQSGPEQLCRECLDVADELTSVLDRLMKQEKQSIWSSFRLALRAVWSQDKLESLQKRLDNLRQQMSMHFLLSMR